MGLGREALSSQLPSNFAHSIIDCPSFFHLRSQALNFLSVASNDYSLAEPLVEDLRWKLVHEVNDPNLTVEGCRSLQLSAEVLKHLHNRSLLSLNQVNSIIVEKYLQPSYCIILQLLEVVIHAAYTVITTLENLLSTSPLSSFSLILAT